jgi:hypothetical protein
MRPRAPHPSLLCVLAAPRLLFTTPTKTKAARSNVPSSARPALSDSASESASAGGMAVRCSSTSLQAKAHHTPLLSCRRCSGADAAAAQHTVTVRCSGTAVKRFRCVCRPAESNAAAAAAGAHKQRGALRHARRAARAARDVTVQQRAAFRPPSEHARAQPRGRADSRFFVGRRPSVAWSAAHGAAGSARLPPRAAQAAHTKLSALISRQAAAGTAAAKRAQRAAAAADPRAAAPERCRRRMKPPAPASPRQRAAWPPGATRRACACTPMRCSHRTRQRLRYCGACCLLAPALPERAPLRCALRVHHCTTARRTRSERCGGGARKGREINCHVSTLGNTHSFPAPLPGRVSQRGALPSWRGCRVVAAAAAARASDGTARRARGAR